MVTTDLLKQSDGFGAPMQHVVEQNVTIECRRLSHSVDNLTRANVTSQAGIRLVAKFLMTVLLHRTEAQDYISKTNHNHTATSRTERDCTSSIGHDKEFIKRISSPSVRDPKIASREFYVQT